MPTIINGTTGVNLVQDGVVGLSTLASNSVNQAKVGTNTLAGTGPAFRVGKTSALQSISSATFTKVTFDTETFDTNNNFASSTFTPTIAGYYQFNANSLFNSISSGTIVIISIYKNGAAYTRGSGGYLNSATGDVELTASALIYANGSTDYFDVYVYQNSGGARDIYNSDTLTSFSGFLAKAA